MTASRQVEDISSVHTATSLARKAGAACRWRSPTRPHVRYARPTPRSANHARRRDRPAGVRPQEHRPRVQQPGRMGQALRPGPVRTLVRTRTRLPHLAQRPLRQRLRAGRGPTDPGAPRCPRGQHGCPGRGRARQWRAADPVRGACHLSGTPGRPGPWTGATVHMPRIGCGLAGGKWSRVQPLTEEGLPDRGVRVTVYDADWPCAQGVTGREDDGPAGRGGGRRRSRNAAQDGAAGDDEHPVGVLAPTLPTRRDRP